MSSPRTLSAWSRSWALLELLACACGHAAAYVPASATNDTSAISAVAQDYIQINWLPAGQSAYSDALSLQIVNSADASDFSGYRGALVRFQEANVSTPTDTPWIALVSCDADADAADVINPTSIDVFSEARSNGAATAIAYSLTSTTCTFDNNFVSIFNGTMDVYVTTSRMSAYAIIRQFSNVSPESYWFDSARLTQAAASVQSMINALGGSSVTSTPSLFGSTSAAPAAAATSATGESDQVSYLVASLLNVNATGAGGQISTQQQNGSGGGSNANTGLAMIILYAITGCVTLLFLVVIMSGAIRAMRHPERYGPRARNANQPGDAGQSRAGGLTKAILDTFPVVKFFSGDSSRGEQATEARDPETGLAVPKDDDDETASVRGPTSVAGQAAATSPEQVAMYPLRSSLESASGPATSAIDVRGQDVSDQPASEASGLGATAGISVGATAASNPQDPAVARSSVDQTNPADVNDSITCPICLLDFEDGDDIRILPCDSRHRFHDACVVPWLLNVSSLCPLCRLDLSKGPEGSANAEQEAGEGPAQSASGHHRGSSASMLATQFRSFLTRPSSTGLRASMASQGQASIPPATVPETSVAQLQSQTASADIAAPAEDDRNPNSSRFLRYVQQRRARVRARTNTRRESISAQNAHRNQSTSLSS